MIMSENLQHPDSSGVSAAEISSKWWNEQTDTTLELPVVCKTALKQHKGTFSTLMR